MSGQALIRLMTGRTLHDLASVRDDVAAKLTKAQAVAEQLKSGSSEEVVKALRVILASDDPVRQEFPQLEAYIDRAQPTHLHAPLLRAALMANIPVWLHGEAGSGKSTTAERSAHWLGLSFRSISLGPSSSKADLMGYRDGHGEYRGTGFREVYEDGGVFLFDEIDNAHPSILTLLNAAIANGHGEFPDGRVARHETTRFIAAANTIGKGATAEYVGRAPIDAATIDRFAFVQMDIDPELERALVLGHDGKQATVLMNCSVGASVSVERIVRRGAAVLAAIEGLRAEGYSLGLTMMQASKGRAVNTVFEYHIPVVRPGDFLDMDTAAFCVAHPSFLRRLIVALNEHEPADLRRAMRFYRGGGYGQPVRMVSELPPHSFVIEQGEGLDLWDDAAVQEFAQEVVNRAIATLDH